VATTVTRDQVLDGMLTALASLKPATGGAVSSAQYLRDLARYAGEFSTEEAFQRGVAGRCPAVLIAYVGERTLATSVGRKVDKVEGTYAAICVVDFERNRNDRSRVYAVMRDVQGLIGARAFGLAITPMRYVADSLVRDDEKCLAYAIRFTTKYRVDYTKQAIYSPLLSTDGSFKTPPDDGGVTIERSIQTLEGA
jgi:phage gp37-like protein